MKKPVASEMPRCAPPYTIGTREEPCQGDLSVVIGPELPFTSSATCCAAARQTCRSLRVLNNTSVGGQQCETLLLSEIDAETSAQMTKGPLQRYESAQYKGQNYHVYHDVQNPDRQKNPSS